VTWNPRRKGWLRPARPAPHDEPAATAPPGPVVVPPVPAFSPAAVAQLLGINRGTVHYYLEQGKLGFIRDNIGERYVLRDELVRFVREYLGRETHD